MREFLFVKNNRVRVALKELVYLIIYLKVTIVMKKDFTITKLKYKQLFRLI